MTISTAPAQSAGSQPRPAPTGTQFAGTLRDLHACRDELGLDARSLAHLESLHRAIAGELREALAPVYRYAGRWLSNASNGDLAWSRAMSAQLRRYLAELTAGRLDDERLLRHVAFWQALSRHVNLIVFTPALLARYERALGALRVRETAQGRPWNPRVDSVLQNLVMFHLALVGSASFAGQLQNFQQSLMYDEATQMPNQIKMVQRVRERIADVGEELDNLALIKVELRYPDRDDLGDGQKSLDETMNQFGERLKRMMRPNDVVGRTGRREFTLILGALRGEGHAMLAGQRVMQILRKPMRIGDKVLVAHTSVGIVLYPSHGRDADLLLDNLSMAVESARSEATGLALYSEERATEDASQRSLEQDLRFALNGNELMLYYHPQVELTTGQLVGSEGLVRWVTSAGKWISPSDIVRAAETGGMMTELTSWAINSAMRQWNTLTRAGIDVPISVNLAASDLQDPEFYAALDQSLHTWGMPPDRLVLEITEGSMINNVDHILELLHQIRARGIQLAIDDFGTGYSSLAYLRKMPISELKIDQSFVRNMLRDQGAARIVRSVIDLAHNLDMHTVAEGVEDLATVEALRDLHCDRIQGYYLAKPIPLDEYAAWSRAWNPDSLSSANARPRTGSE